MVAEFKRDEAVAEAWQGSRRQARPTRVCS